MTLTTGTTSVSVDIDATDEQQYNETLTLLSEGSVHKHFDPLRGHRLGVREVRGSRQ